MNKFKIIGVVLLMILFTGQSAYSGVGSSGAQFLQIGSGVRALSMGSAYVAVADGLDAIFWNPAGLSTMKNKLNIGFSHTEYFADMSYESFAFSTPALGGVVGAFGHGLFSGDIDVTTVEEPEGTGETYSANDYAFGFSYSRTLTQKFSAGVSFKVVNQNIAELSSYGWAMDIGAYYNTGLLNNLRIGFSVTNFGPDLRYNGDDLVFRTKVYQDEVSQEEDVRAEYLTEEYQLPLKLQLGLAIDVFDTEHHKMVAAIDGINPNDQDEIFGAGIEYTLLNRYAFRAGYSTFNDKGFTAGFGLLVGSAQSGNMVIDYGFEDHQYLGEFHRFGVNFSF